MTVVVTSCEELRIEDGIDACIDRVGMTTGIMSQNVGTRIGDNEEKIC